MAVIARWQRKAGDVPVAAKKAPPSPAAVANLINKPSARYPSRSAAVQNLAVEQPQASVKKIDA